MAMRLMRKPLFVAALYVLMLGSSGASSIYAAPNAPQYVPEQVGRFGEAEDICEQGDVPTPFYITDIILHYGVSKCEDGLDRLNADYDHAYREAEDKGFAPGFPTNDIHAWEGIGVLIQDFSGSPIGDGWGAIICNPGGDGDTRSDPYYVGGGHWVAYKQAVQETGILPGYPINLPHQQNNAIIQDFRGGSWGDAAIIGGDNAFVVAGRHWEAYQAVNGSARLGNPTGPWHQADNGLYVQEFEGGEIGELDHEITVIYYDGSPADYLYID